jgi:hypothetical protein
MQRDLRVGTHRDQYKVKTPNTAGVKRLALVWLGSGPRCPTASLLAVVAPGVALLLLGGLVVACGGEVTLVPTSAPVPTPPSFVGTLLMQKAGGPPGSPRLYELQGAWNEPRPIANPAFDAAVITDSTVAVSPDWRLFVFQPYRLLDSKTDQVSPLTVPPPYRIGSESRLGSAAFSPDGRWLAYILQSVHEPDVSHLFVLDLASGRSTWLAGNRCAQYNAGRVCTTFGPPSWMDSETLVFTDRDLLPSSFEAFGDEKDPHEPNRLTVISHSGFEHMVSKIPIGKRYRAVGGTVFQYDGYPPVAEAWFDGNDLRNQRYTAHEFSGSSEFCPETLYAATVSPDARYILGYAEGHWGLYEVRTGQCTILGTPWTRGSPLGDCVWSPDLTSLACILGSEGSKEASLLVIPLSDEPGGVVYTYSKITEYWELLGWGP